MDYTDSWNNRVNRTLEFGAVNTTFYVYIEMTAADSSLNVDHKIWIGGYNVDVVRPEPLPGPEQDWLTIGLIIGGSVLAVVVVTVVIVVVRKKKRGY